MVTSGEEKKKILTRLRRIEGQTRGIQRMVLLLMENHLLHCVSEAIQEGKGEEKISEIMDVIKHYTRA